MKIVFIGLIFFQISLSILSAQDSIATKGVLTVIVTGLENDEGKAMIALCNSQEDYESKGEAYRAGIAPINNKKAVWIFENVVFGTYALKVFHDEDDDDELDTNFLGIPSEDYGFSNNAVGSLRPCQLGRCKIFVRGKI